jgi:hypothetical protein
MEKSEFIHMHVALPGKPYRKWNLPDQTSIRKILANTSDTGNAEVTPDVLSRFGAYVPIGVHNPEIRTNRSSQQYGRRPCGSHLPRR